MCCITASWCLANNYRGDEKEYKYSKEKEIEKVFKVGSNSELEVDGIYSDIIVTTWDQPQIAFKIKVIVKSDNEKQMLERFNAISVLFKQEGNDVEAKTVIDNQTNTRFDGSMSIKYYVSVPKDVLMDLETKYGDIVVETVEKNFKADVVYGSLTAGNLLADNEIDMKYADLNIASAKNLELEISYGDGKINKVEFIDAEIQYGNLTAKEIYRGNFKNQYSNIRIEKIVDIKAKNQYSDMKLANVIQKIDIDAQYSDLNATLNCAAPYVEIEGQYSDIMLNINKEASFRYDFEVMYGDIICGNFMKPNSGRIHNGRTAGTHGDGTLGNIKVELMYGDIKIE